MLSSLLGLLPVVHIQNYIKNIMLWKRRAKFNLCNSIIYNSASTSVKNQLCWLLVSIVNFKVQLKRDILGKVGWCHCSVFPGSQTVFQGLLVCLLCQSETTWNVIKMVFAFGLIKEKKKCMWVTAVHKSDAPLWTNPKSKCSLISIENFKIWQRTIRLWRKISVDIACKKIL